ncbi:MAG TPA: SMP-30/gluconolactonase/LRE family protein [Pyrinomonadaceae bacterium]
MTKRKKILLAFSSLLGVLALYLLLWPVPIEPEAWTPPVAPKLEGVYATNERLSGVERLPAGAGHKPEGVAIDREGRIYSGMEDGQIVRWLPGGSGPEVFAKTGGRPLGMEFDTDGILIVADANKGLLSISQQGAVTVLSTEADGVPFRCTNDLDIAADGTIYFTDASSRFPLSVYKQDLFEHKPNGRLMAYEPQTKRTRILLDKLYFANGVAISPDQSFVLLAETGKYRVLRVWLGGEKKNLTEIFIDNLPGFPDNISSNGNDKFWLALVTPRSPLLDKLLPRPFLRKVVLRLPEFLQPSPQRYGFVLGLNRDGEVVANLQDPSGQAFALISNVLEYQGKLYLGSIGEDSLGRIPVPTEGR